MNDLIPINLLIGDRTYRVRVEPKDEEVVRKTIKLINDKIIEFKTQFAGKDMQDYIGMVILWYATQTNPLSGTEGSPEFSATLGKLEEQIDKVLS